MKFTTVFVATLFSAALARPRYIPRDSSFLKQNGEAAIALNNQFKSLTVNSSCTAGENACVNGEFAQCVNGAFVLTSCGTGEVCAALPLVNSEGTSITCATQAQVNSRIAATGATSASNATSSASPSNATSAPPCMSTLASASAVAIAPSSTAAASTGNASDAQSSFTLLSSLVQTGFSQNGTEDSSPEPGEIASVTSTNNFINFCATVNLPLTNGTQVASGSCNPAPMGVMPNVNNTPTAKFVYPANLDTVKANTTFTVVLAIDHLDTGFFVNPATNYFAAPQMVNETTGNVMGHSHVVIERLTALNQTTPTNPTKFSFFKGLNDVAVNGTLSTVVTGGVPAGVYRLASINAAANHQPILASVAQHGAIDDMVYFMAE